MLLCRARSLLQQLPWYSVGLQEVGLGLGQGRGMRWPACRRRGATCAALGKMENRLTYPCKDPARAGGVGRKLAFTATGPSLKIKDCWGEVDLLDQMGQEHLWRQAGQPGEESLNKEQHGK